MSRKAPRVSIVLPNLNYRQFLEERFHSILAQTLTDWELIVVDGYSDDGAWELIQEFARNDGRIQASQAPREGIYAALNRGIHIAQGEYVYIATSDDTMSPDCLEKMVAALDAHPECDICHCCLKITNEQGEPTGLWETYLPNLFYGELIQHMHIRKAPYDGILYCALLSMYTSLTQLLTRRAVFQKIGVFRDNWGPRGDFEWGLRAALTCNILHLPEFLATWRKHRQQATIVHGLPDAQLYQQLCEMIAHALPVLQFSAPNLYKQLSLSRLLYFYQQEQFTAEIEACGSLLQKFLVSIRFLWARSDIMIRLTWRVILQQHPFRLDRFVFLHRELTRLNLDRSQYITILPNQ